MLLNDLSVLASLIILWATTRGISLPVTNSLLMHSQQECVKPALISEHQRGKPARLDKEQWSGGGDISSDVGNPYLAAEKTYCGIHVLVLYANAGLFRGGSGGSTPKMAVSLPLVL
jgi:hypothetical protein